MKADVNTASVARRTPSRVRNVAPFLLTIVFVGLFSFLSGGYILTRSAPVAILYLLLAAVWLRFLRRRSRPGTLYLLALAVFGIFVAWAGFSVLWSFGPDLSWVAFDIAALYLAAVAVLGFTPVRALQLRVSVYGLLAVLVAVAVYAYLGKVIPDIVTHAHDNARLDSPVGYWNVLALMMVMGIAIVLAVAGDRAVGAVWRVLAVAGGVVLAFTFFFTLSRGGWVVLLIALFLYFAFTPTRLASFAALLAIAVPVGLVLFKVRHLGTLFTATDNDALRTLQGHALLRYSLAALLVAVGAQTAIALVHRAVPWPRWARVAAGVAVIGVLVLGVGGGSWRFLEARGGMTYLHSRITAFVSDSDQTSSNEGAVRLVSMNTGRPPLWREALDQSRYDRLLGTGAGTFVFTHYRFRTTGGVVRHAHSEWFNVLSELGVVGLVLLVAAMVLLVAAALGNPFAGRDDPLRPALVALQAGIVVFVVHISWDWDWDMAAAGVTFFFLVAVCSSYLATRKADQRRSAPSRVEAAGALAPPPGPGRPGPGRPGPERLRAGAWRLRARLPRRLPVGRSRMPQWRPTPS